MTVFDCLQDEKGRYFYRHLARTFEVWNIEFSYTRVSWCILQTKKNNLSNKNTNYVRNMFV